MPRWPGFIGGSNATQSATLDAEQTINMYVEQAQSDGAANRSGLFPTPGFSRWTDLSMVADVGARAALVASGRLFVVFGSGLYEFDANGTPTKRNPALALAVDQNPAQLVYNGVVGGQLGIASGGSIYTLVLGTNTFAAAPTLPAVGFSHLAFAGGYGFAFQATTGKTFVSGLNDLTSWSLATFFQRSLFADPLQAIFADGNNLVWCLGTDSFEVRYNSGVGTQPWVPLSGLVGRYGIAAPFAFAPFGNGNAWLARNPEGLGRFVVTNGASPQPVSSYAMNTAVAGYLRSSRIDDAEVLMYEQEGHTFANVSFPAAKRTWSDDVEAQGWAERRRWNPNAGWDVWSPRVHVVAFGKHLIGDRTTGTLYQMDTTIATEIDGSGIRRVRRAPVLNAERQRLAVDRLELYLDAGLGVVPAGRAATRRLMLRLSKDNGRTWGNEATASVGRIGEFGRRVYWSQLGVARPS
jgi:hypothetical protein